MYYTNMNYDVSIKPMTQNKEAKSSAPTRTVAFLLRKNKEAKILSSSWGLGFCFAKQGGFYEDIGNWISTSWGIKRA